MRATLRSFAALLLAVAVVTCVDSPVAPSSGAGSSAGRASIAFAPRFASGAAQAGALYDLNGFLVNQVQVIVMLNGQQLADTTIAYSASDSTFSLNLNIAADPGDQVGFTLQYLSGTTVLYSGSGTATTFPVGGAAPANANPVVLIPVGPGATAVHVAVTPSVGSFPTTMPIPFGATVTDGSNTAIAGALLSWTVSDPTIATIGATTGLLQPTGKRGSVTVSASTLDGVTGTAVISLVPSPTKLVAVSGGGQSGTAGSTLAQPFAVQVQASDDIGASGQTVLFSVNGGSGGSVGTTTATTDANGNAQTTVTLGTTGGTYTVTATSGSFTASVTETATAASVATLTLVSGGGQTDSVKQQLLAPLVVKAADQFGNPKSGVTVTWTRTAGSGAPSATSTTTGADGTTSITYTFGSVVGTESVAASATGVGTPVTFVETATTGGAATITAVSGGGQVVAIGVALPGPLVVRVVDAGGNAVTGAHVTWTITNGTFATSQPTTDATGQATATMVAGQTSGPVVVTAALSNGVSVSFSETVGSGLPAAVKFTAVPSSIAVSTTLAPAVQVTVLDAGGNPVTVVSSSVTLTLTGGSGGATLSGTLTQRTINGIATFSDLSINQTGSGYTLVATVSGLNPATSVPLTVSAGSATKMVLVGQSSYALTAGAAAPSAAGIQVTDVNGNGVAGVTVAVTADSNGVPKGTVSIPTDAGGLITFAEVAVATGSSLQTESAGAHGITFTAALLLGSPIRIVVNVAAGPASQIQFFGAIPQSTAGVALAPVTVGVTDQYGNVISAATGSVSIAINSGPANDTLSGTLTQPLVSGIATFTNLVLNKSSAAQTYSLRATSGTFPAALSMQFGVSPGSAASLSIGTVPASVVAASSIGNGSGVRVTVLDAEGNQTAVGIPVTMAITGGTVGAVLSGSSSPPMLQTVNGAVTFAILSINLPGTAYQLVASSPGLTSGTSASFNVTGGLATKVKFTVQPSNTQAGVTMSPSIQAALYDASGNIATSATNTISLTIKAGTGNGGATILNGSVNPTNGVSTFSTLTLNLVANNYQFVANGAGGLVADTSIAFNVTAGVEHQIRWITQPALSDSTGYAFSPAPQVEIDDQYGNPTASTDSVTLTLGNNGPGATLSGARVQAVNGVATFANLTINKVGSNFQLIAAAPVAVTNVSSNSFSVRYPGFPKLRLLTGGAVSPPGGTSVTYTIGAVDSLAPTNVPPIVGATINLSPVSGAMSFSSTTLVTDVNGQATVTITFAAGTSSQVWQALFSNGQASLSDAVFVQPAPNRLGLTIQPSSTGSSGIALATSPVVQIEDSIGNIVHDSGVVITASVAASSHNGTILGSATATTNASGQATFTNIGITGLVGSDTLSFTAGALTAIRSNPIALGAGTATTIEVSPTQPGNTLSFVVGSPPASPVILVVDGAGNPVAGYNVTVASTAAGVPVISQTYATQSNGTITLSALNETYTEFVGTFLFTFSDPSGMITGANVASPLTVIITGPPYQLVSTGSPGSLANGATFQVAYEVVDMAGTHIVAPVVSQVTLAVSAGPVGGVLQTTGSLTVSTVNGIATFTGLSVSGTPSVVDGVYTLTATSPGLISSSTAAFSINGESQVRAPRG